MDKFSAGENCALPRAPHNHRCQRLNNQTAHPRNIQEATLLTTQQTTQHKVEKLIQQLEALRCEAEKLADSPLAGDGANYFLGQESAFLQAINLVKRIQEAR